ncbi:hypothetical protein BMS3Bbin08_00084 [bacterium BMS3Bbin08]|nr:hypothetical protein BMS3Bbin08_00084 [bacterium BMS3Bbin08]
MIYPQIENLPLQVDASTWTWSKTEKGKFWIGHERDGTKWLVKGSGSFYALRERASAYLLQTLGINSQSSAFMILPEGSLPVADKPEIERSQLAIRFIDEHGTNCVDEQFQKALKILRVMACLCGANERSEILFSEDHIMYVVDNEQMFQDPPDNPITCADGFEIEYDTMMELTLDLCRKLSVIDNRDIQVFTAIPDGYVVNELWPISKLMESTVDFAKQFLMKYDDVI